MRLFDPELSRRRNIHRLLPVLRERSQWRDAQVGRLRLSLVGIATRLTPRAPWRSKRSSVMRLIEALRIANSPALPDAQPFIVALACSFTPLHLETMVKASLRLALPHKRVEVRTGLYGDLVGMLTA